MCIQHLLGHSGLPESMVDAITLPQRGSQHDKLEQYLNSGLLTRWLTKFLKRKTSSKDDGLEVTVKLIVYPWQGAENICCMVLKTESGSCKSNAKENTEMFQLGSRENTAVL